eukprot:TRINITY_DN2185_c1_g1_i2.p1 TRINITY_DN2185_c1_g1~~TRINITY_DN2185_c1_g1_i2.p1  ORF type:complete len:338 (+),score=52.88 TRINITY_DN2185_c1_g1_i2:81-1094(+)
MAATVAAVPPGYRAAGVLPLRRTEAGVEILLAFEPKHAAWGPFGGKVQHSDAGCAAATACRELAEEARRVLPFEEALPGVRVSIIRQRARAGQRLPSSGVLCEKGSGDALLRWADGSEGRETRSWWDGPGEARAEDDLSSLCVAAVLSACRDRSSPIYSPGCKYAAFPVWLEMLPPAAREELVQLPQRLESLPAAGTRPPQHAPPHCWRPAAAARWVPLDDPLRGLDPSANKLRQFPLRELLTVLRQALSDSPPDLDHHGSSDDCEPAAHPPTQGQRRRRRGGRRGMPAADEAPAAAAAEAAAEGALQTASSPDPAGPAVAAHAAQSGTSPCVVMVE